MFEKTALRGLRIKIAFSGGEGLVGGGGVTFARDKYNNLVMGKVLSLGLGCSIFPIPTLNIGRTEINN